LIKILKFIKNIFDPMYWTEKISDKSGLNDTAMKSPLRKWALELTGWKWWLYQIVVGGVFFIIIECLLNLIGMTILPWG
tara:strand:+ start:135 stop:371 length:237 start_codon:yes stop_codon:yes gene_type:complete